MLDLADGDLRFGLKLNFVGNVVSSSRSIFNPVLGQVHSAIQEALKTGSRICQVNTDGAVLNLATVAVILSRRANGVVSALASPRFINQADGFSVAMVAGDNLLAAITQQFLIPLDGLQKTL